MSGGVDSAVAAARVVEAGHDVVGVHLSLSRDPVTARTGHSSPKDAHDARLVADVLGVPFQVWDLAERFDVEVVADFVAEYAVGRTPNPCVRCNARIKFSALLDRALALGFDAVCTGHYARRAPDPLRGPSDGALASIEGIPELHRAADPVKDQSYVLAMLAPWQIARALFPLGETAKPQVRREATERGLLVAGKRDSNDICFITGGDTQGWLTRRLGSRPGAIVDVDGRVLGEHTGTYGFTVGQRKGLRLGRPAADGRPRYVLDVQAATDTVVVGPREELQVTRLVAVRPSWCGRPPRAGDGVGVQVRAHGEEVPGTVLAVRDEQSPAGEGQPPAGEGPGTVVTVETRLDRPITGAAPGQILVLYDGSRVIGAATLTRPTSCS